MSQARFYVTQQLSVKEFYLKIIPWRLFTFRVCPGTKVNKTSIGQNQKDGPTYPVGDKLSVISCSFLSLPTVVLTRFIST